VRVGSRRSRVPAAAIAGSRRTGRQLTAGDATLAAGRRQRRRVAAGKERALFATVRLLWRLPAAARPAAAAPPVDSLLPPRHPLVSVRPTVGGQAGRSTAAPAGRQRLQEQRGQGGCGWPGGRQPPTIPGGSHGAAAAVGRAWRGTPRSDSATPAAARRHRVRRNGRRQLQGRRGSRRRQHRCAAAAAATAAAGWHHEPPGPAAAGRRRTADRGATPGATSRGVAGVEARRQCQQRWLDDEGVPTPTNATPRTPTAAAAGAAIGITAATAAAPPPSDARATAAPPPAHSPIGFHGGRWPGGGRSRPDPPTSRRRRRLGRRRRWRRRQRRVRVSGGGGMGLWRQREGTCTAVGVRQPLPFV